MRVSGRYIKLLRDREYRLEWAEKIAMGFELPGRSGGPQLANPPELATLANSFPSEKQDKSFRFWWTRGDSNPRPPRCERGARPSA
jgi:hypothetical protein